MVPIDEVRIYGKKHLHELMTRHGWALPSLTSGFTTLE
jgi:hypothetical protein